MDINTQIRFNPATDFNGDPGVLTVYAVEDSTTETYSTNASLNHRTVASGGNTSHISGAGVTIGISFDNVNDAPSFDNNVTLSNINEDAATIAGETVLSLLNSQYNDSNDAKTGFTNGAGVNSFVGIAIVGNATNTATEGTWEFSSNSGTTWVDIGTPTTATALVLDTTTLIRFSPVSHYNGFPGVLTVHAVDNSTSQSFSTVTTPVEFDTTADDHTSHVAQSGVTIAIEVNKVNDPPIISNLDGDSVTYTEGGATSAAAIVIDASQNATVFDRDIGDYGSDMNGGYLLVAFTPLNLSGDTTSEILSVNHEGTAVGEISFVGTTVTYMTSSGSETVGTVDATETGQGVNLKINLSTGADEESIGALLNQITYQNTSQGPTSGARTMTITLDDNDGDDNISSAITTTVIVVPTNDDPFISATTTSYTIDDNQTTSPFADMVLDDYDQETTLTVTVTQKTDSTTTDTTQANGVLSDTQSSVNFSHSAGVYTFSGDQTSVTTIIQGLLFTPTKDLVEVGQSFDTIFDVNIEDENTATSGVYSPSTTVTTNSVNDIPTLSLSGITSNTLTYQEATITSSSANSTLVAPHVNFGTVAIADDDLNDDLTVTISLNQVNWPADGRAPDAEDYSGTATNPDAGIANPPNSEVTVVDVYGGTLSLSCGEGCSNLNFAVGDGLEDTTMTFTGPDLDVESALTNMYFKPNETQHPGSDYNGDGVSDYDLTSTVTIQVSDETATTASNINITETVTIAPDSSTLDDDPPEAILTYSTSCNPISLTCTSATLYAGWSYDPDVQDSSNVLQYWFYMQPGFALTVDCDGVTTVMSDTNPCVLATPVLDVNVNAVTGSAFRLEVVSGSLTSDQTADLYDETTIDIPNQDPSVRLYHGQIDCSPLHYNTVYVDDQGDNDDTNDCFCATAAGTDTNCFEADDDACSSSADRVEVLTANNIEYPLNVFNGFTACGYDPDGDPLTYRWDWAESTGNLDITDCASTDTKCARVEGVEADLTATSTNTASTSVTKEETSICYCSSSTCDVDADGDGVSDCLTATGNICTPYDEDGDGLGDTCDTNDTSTVSITNQYTGVTVSVGYLSDSAYVQSSQVDVSMVDRSSPVSITGSTKLQVSVFDGEDIETTSVQVYFCSAFFGDSDNDGYGDPNDYQADCTNNGTYYDQNGDTSTTLSTTLQTFSQSLESFRGIDCSDDASVTDVIYDGSTYTNNDTKTYPISSTVTSYTAAEVGEYINWYLDYDSDYYGNDTQTGYYLQADFTTMDTDNDGTLSATEIDSSISTYYFVDEDNNGYLTADETMPMVYGDTDGDGIADRCYTSIDTIDGSNTSDQGVTKQYHIVDSNGAYYNYLLNNDDCNDWSTFVDGGDNSFSSPEQNPETTWYADFDNDGYGAGAAHVNTNVYMDKDLDCYCDSGCSGCVSKSSSDGSSTGACSATTLPLWGTTTDTDNGNCWSFASAIQQCNNPESAAGGSVGVGLGVTHDTVNSSYTTGVNVSWLLDSTVVDCHDGRADVNEDVLEVCDGADFDENCNGLSDDNDPGVSNAFTYYQDADGDGYPNSNSYVNSCDGGADTDYMLVYPYVPSSVLDSLGNPVDNSAEDSDYCICPEGSCSYNCRLVSDLSTCTANPDAATTCQTYPALTDPYDPQEDDFDDADVDTYAEVHFNNFAFDCDDTDELVFPSATEGCDGVLNDCNYLCGQDDADNPATCTSYTATIPSDEIDLDNDSYVECGFEGGTWRGATAPNVGVDCSPTDINVYPNATSLCDGQYNDCSLWVNAYKYAYDDCYCDSDTCDGICLTASGDSCTATQYSYEVLFNNSQNICYCAAIDTDDNGTLDDYDNTDCVDSSGAVCTVTYVDSDALLTNSCDIVSGMTFSPGAPLDQQDNDGDCYVDCYTGSGSWRGGDYLLGSSCTTLAVGEDCDDGDVLVFPGATEICDGQFNNCSDGSYLATSAPSDELDDDADGYVDCVAFDSTNWVGDSSVSGGDDCDDTDLTRYPTAPEVCDGQFNDCENPLLDAFTGAVGEDCYCTDDTMSNCRTIAGEVCTPSGDVAELTIPETITAADGSGTAAYTYQALSCYCPDTDCALDIDGDSISDCLNSAGQFCEPANTVTAGYADNCLTNPNVLVGVSRDFYELSSATAYTSPLVEIDDDNDNYVDCVYNADTWVGPSRIIGGSDCNDDPNNNGEHVYPDYGVERCDGIFNDCSAATYQADSAPDDELDDDADGYVDCSYSSTIWIGSDIVIGGDDCDDSDVSVYPLASEICDGQFNNCSDMNYDAASAPADELDADADGYVSCTKPDGITWQGSNAVQYSDCNDSDANTYPTASEICDSTYNNCTHPANPDYTDAITDSSGADVTAYRAHDDDCYYLNSDCTYDTDGDLSVDSDSNGQLLAVDISSGGACSVTDLNADSIADSCQGGVYNGVVGSCLCNSDCTDCYDEDGNSCDVSADDTCVREINQTGLTFDAAATNQNTYNYVKVDCLCPTPDCSFDSTGDGNGDCYTPDGQMCDSVASVSASNTFNSCVSTDTSLFFASIFTDNSGDQEETPFEELDKDGDNHVECAEFDQATYRAGGGSFLVTAGLDCDDNDGYVFPDAPSICDGQYNDCNNASYSDAGVNPAADTPTDEYDDDGDGYVDCAIGSTNSDNDSGPWRGSTQPFPFYTALSATGSIDLSTATNIYYSEWTDASNNTFNGYYLASDCSGDCIQLDGSACSGAVVDISNCTARALSDLTDCKDDDPDVYPFAEELCDFKYNDCTDSDYSDTGTPDNELDIDGDGYVQCDAFNTAEYDCNNNDATVYPTAAEVCDGQYNDCTNTDYSLSSAPEDELDGDGDGYVDCAYDASTWLGNEYVFGGSDCDDADASTYPSAPILCDGKDNDCDGVIDATEIDDDQDGWVECTRTATLDWSTGDAPNVHWGTDECKCADQDDCEGAKETCLLNSDKETSCSPASCDPIVELVLVDCDDSAADTHPRAGRLERRNDSFDSPLSPISDPFACMKDSDGDGYGDYAPSGDIEAGSDCNDDPDSDGDEVHPYQDESCESDEQIDSDCDGSVNTARAPYVLLDPLVNLYRDDDGDGFGKTDEAATPACEVAEGFVVNATDCDDTNAGVYPGAEEICDGIDQDCDNTIDEADSLAEQSVSLCITMYRDVDQDEYGDSTVFECLCQEGTSTSVEHDNYDYVINGGDCYDFNSDIKPLSCADGIDNDKDGFSDEDDSECYNGLQEGALILADVSDISELSDAQLEEYKEVPTEKIDGHDNDCDGRVAAIELDCDDDGAFPMLPVPVTSENNYSFERAADVGLDACDGLEKSLSCWGENLRLECDTITAEVSGSTVSYDGSGLWMLKVSESADGYGGRYDGGYRDYDSTPSCSSTDDDCDDHCSSRCSGQVETCDGLDNNCSMTTAGSGTEGIPDALNSDVPIYGTIRPEEIDIDSDGYLSCDDFSLSSAETQVTVTSCSDSIVTSEGSDCNNLCFYTSPSAEERCDGFVGVCDGDSVEATDADRDSYNTCGAWGNDESELTEDLFVLVWLNNINWDERGSDPVVLQKPNPPTDGLTPEEVAANRVADLMDEQDSAIADSGYEEDDSADLFVDLDNVMPMSGTDGISLADMVPLIPPRPNAPDCDNYLHDQIQTLIGVENYVTLMSNIDNLDSDTIQSTLLDVCVNEDYDPEVDAVEDKFNCAVVRISLSDLIDEQTYDTISERSNNSAFPDSCEEKPEQWLARSMWQQDRILASRQIVVEWECLRMYGRGCERISDDQTFDDDWQYSMRDASRWLQDDQIWWKEIGRFNAEPITGGTLMSCWGDPTDPTQSLSTKTGGDCNDDDALSHRDNAEGPGDLIGLYLTGTMADCSTCLDGIDNNCDGNIDCADPACAQCFVGQGVGCGGGAESPCMQSGCSTPSTIGNQRLYRSLVLIMLALGVGVYRRRRN
ncbi:MAG: MopE-related protein [Myxococcota bacterium]|nr:MopE-related protein [Myxococcota bacterium]